jgi:hypothetical protein
MPSNPEVDAWFAKYDSPMKPVVQRVREIILNADPRIRECITAQAPTFTFGGNLASFNPRSKHHASLMFHTGAEIPGRFPSLERTGDIARHLKLASVAAADAARGELESIVQAWCALKAGRASAEPTNGPGLASTRRGLHSTVSNRPAKRGSIPPASRQSQPSMASARMKGRR